MQYAAKSGRGVAVSVLDHGQQSGGRGRKTENEDGIFKIG